MIVDVSVPATLSNLGPGFDVLGMALSISNRFTFETIDDTSRFELDGEAVSPGGHVSFRTMIEASNRFGVPMQCGVGVTGVEDVPRSRGLGSSATARVAGLEAWCQITGHRPPLAEALAFIAAAEGHPDNGVPAMVGGLTLCAESQSGLHHIRLDPPAGLQVALCIPDRTVQTSAARRALPDQYCRDDVVFNVSRVAFLITGLLNGDDDAIALGCEDRIHQKYRSKLIGPVDEALAAARNAGAVAGFISGSGSTLAAFITDPAVNPKHVASAMADAFGAAGTACRVRTASPALRGAWLAA